MGSHLEATVGEHGKIPLLAGVEKGEVPQARHARGSARDRVDHPPVPGIHEQDPSVARVDGSIVAEAELLFTFVDVEINPRFERSY